MLTFRERRSSRLSPRSCRRRSLSSRPRRRGRSSSGRRRVLADWIVSKDNPMTARVLINRLWQHHFGRGIVVSTNDFGKFGTLPTHPQLLDWLADDFVRGGWQLKRMHRLLMMSNAYRTSSAGERGGAEGRSGQRSVLALYHAAVDGRGGA